MAYLYLGLPPDGYASANSGWPRADADELTDHELYCYQACKTRLRRERVAGRDTPHHFLPDL